MRGSDLAAAASSSQQPQPQPQPQPQRTLLPGTPLDEALRLLLCEDPEERPAQGAHGVCACVCMRVCVSICLRERMCVCVCI